jgi:hypothetical protein
MDHLLELADLPPPEPLELTLDALSGLPAGDRLLLHHNRQPYPLYDLLRGMGHRWEVAGREGDWQILITPGPATPAGP